MNSRSILRNTEMATVKEVVYDVPFQAFPSLTLTCRQYVRCDTI